MTTPEAPTKKRRRRFEKNAALMDDETLEFIQAIDYFRRRYDKSFPSWSEVLDIARAMGYRKVAEPVPIGEIYKQAPVEDAPVEAMDEVDPVEPVEPAAD